MPLTLDMQEKCLWYYCETSKSKIYKIYNSTTTTNKPDYKASCSQILCNISYDNNRITISLGGEGKVGCILEEEFIKSDCPSITVTVPDDTFSVVDSINSECGNNNIKPNRAKISDSHPSWDIITETRTCVLGYLLNGGNANIDGPVGVGGSAGVPSNNCGPMVASPVGNCGKSGDDSRPTTTYIGNTRVIFPLATSNPQAAEYLYREWESNMRQAYNNIAACKNTIPRDIVHPYVGRNYDVGDIVEGIVPGTCSFKIGSIDYPSVSYRAPASVTNGTVSVTVAYYTYSYKRPKNIQDILIGNNSQKCNQKASQNNNISIPRITSNYDTPTCSDTPICYDTDVSKCSSLDYCCQANK